MGQQTNLGTGKGVREEVYIIHVEQLATSEPSWQNPIPLTGSLWAGKLCISLLARTSHRKTASSYEPEARMLPLGEKARQCT